MAVRVGLHHGDHFCLRTFADGLEVRDDRVEIHVDDRRAERRDAHERFAAREIRAIASRRVEVAGLAVRREAVALAWPDAAGDGSRRDDARISRIARGSASTMSVASAPDSPISAARSAPARPWTHTAAAAAASGARPRAAKAATAPPSA